MKNKFIALAFVALSSFFSAQNKKNAQISKLYENYVSMKNALASDSSAKTSASASEFLKTLSAVDSSLIPENIITMMKNNAKVISDSDHIKIQRTKFKNISNNMIPLASEFKLTKKPVYVQYCPMAKAGWLSNENTVINPYYGSSMLNCGTVQKEIK